MDFSRITSAAYEEGVLKYWQERRSEPCLRQLKYLHFGQNFYDVIQFEKQ